MGDDLLRRSDELDERIALSPDVNALVRASRRNWLLIRILGVSVALDLALSAGVAYLAVQAHQTAAQANSIEAQARTACLAGNQARAGQIQLWHYVLDLTSATQRTPEQQTQAEQFRAYINQLFAPRHC